MGDKKNNTLLIRLVIYFKRRKLQFVYYKIDIIKYDETTENIDACYIYCYCYNTTGK